MKIFQLILNKGGYDVTVYVRKGCKEFSEICKNVQYILMGFRFGKYGTQCSI